MNLKIYTLNQAVLVMNNIIFSSFSFCVRFGMLAPMLVQMERQIDREIAAEQRLQQSQTRGSQSEGVGEEETEEQDESDSELEDEQPVLMYGPAPQIVTNDLKSLDEMVSIISDQHLSTCLLQFC